MPNPCSAQRSAPLSIAPVLLALLVSSGCASDSDKGTAARSPSGGSSLDAHNESRSADPAGALPPRTSGPDSFGSSGSAGTGGGAFGAPMAPGSADGERGDLGTEPGTGDADAGAIDPIDIEPGQLTAGEWSDLDDWAFWRGLHDGDAQCEQAQQCPAGVAARWSSHWGFETGGRVAVRVSSGGDPVIDAVVELQSGQQTLYAARTDSKGRAELFAGLLAAHTGKYALAVQAGGQRIDVDDVQPGTAEPIAIEFPVAHAPPPSLDLMFVVDTTGSMGDELGYIQAELDHVIEQVRDEIGSQLAVRLSVNFYRDQGDEYVVRDFPFTSEIAQALDQLGAQSADGGGDTPEAVERALDNALNDHDWSEAATARLLFLVLDAPPHFEDSRVRSLHDSALAAARKGVQIIPLAASGVDEQTEFLLRMLAIASNGTYTFLTDHSGIGNAHLEPTIGPYDVELLDDLLVRVIRERL